MYGWASVCDVSLEYKIVGDFSLIMLPGLCAWAYMCTVKDRCFMLALSKNYFQEIMCLSSEANVLYWVYMYTSNTLVGDLGTTAVNRTPPPPVTSSSSGVRTPCCEFPSERALPGCRSEALNMHPVTSVYLCTNSVTVDSLKVTVFDPGFWALESRRTLSCRLGGVSQLANEYRALIKT